MAVRRPLYVTSAGNLREMSSTQIGNVQSMVAYQHGLNPAVTLSVISNNTGSHIGQISDTRLIAGTTNSSATAFPTAPNTTTKTINYKRVRQTVASVSAPTLPTGFTRPLYWTGSAMRVMSDQDFLDTFILPAATALGEATNNAAQAGTYTVNTSNTVTNRTLVSSTPIFTDTRADASLYNTTDETLDQPKDINDYYLHIRDPGPTVPSYQVPLGRLSANGNFKEYPQSDFNSLLQAYIRYATTNISGYQISYTIGETGSGNIRGSGMNDTKLDSQVTRQKFVNANDYRAQDVPAGSSQSIATYYLRINLL
jgi:hypothetical protein